MLTVAEIMTREPYTLGPDDTLATARQLLAEHHIRHIPIVSADGGRATLRVPKAQTAATTARLLSELPIKDLTIEDPPIEDVIERVFSSEGE